MPNKQATRRRYGPPRYKSGQLVRVFNFQADDITLGPQGCFDHDRCADCPSYSGSSCSTSGPRVSKQDILTVVDARATDSDLTEQLVLLLTPSGLLGSLDSEMLDFVPETMPEEEKKYHEND